MEVNFCPPGYKGPTRTELREYGSSVVLVELPSEDVYIPSQPSENRDRYSIFDFPPSVVYGNR